MDIELARMQNPLLGDDYPLEYCEDDYPKLPSELEKLSPILKGSA